jgi:hypothetical protein
MFMAVFALSEGGRYGWWKPLEDFSVAGVRVWPATAPVSVVAVSLLLSAALFTCFVRVERSRSRQGRDPLFDFALLQHRSFRYGLLTMLILAMGQLVLLFALPLFLQNAIGLSAQGNGLWLLPIGLLVIVGAQVGGRLTRRMSLGSIITMGLLCEIAGLVLVVVAVTPDITFWTVLPGLCLFGLGIGFASSQLTSVILSEIDSARSGVASGASSTGRQMGGAFGTAIVGSLITVQTTNRAVNELRAANLSDAVKRTAIAAVHTQGADYRGPAGLPGPERATIDHIMTRSLASGTRISLLFAVGIVAVGTLLSTLIPRVKPVGHEHDESVDENVIETLEPFEPIDIDAATL